MNSSLSLASLVAAALLATGCAGSASTPTAPSSLSGSPTSSAGQSPLSGSRAPTVEPLAGTWHSPVASACRGRRPDHTRGRELHADVRRRSPVDARGLQHMRRHVHLVRGNADCGTCTGVHAGGVPDHGVRVHLYASARWREQRDAAGRRTRALVGARRVALHPIADGILPLGRIHRLPDIDEGLLAHGQGPFLRAVQIRDQRDDRGKGEGDDDDGERPGRPHQPRVKAHGGQ